MRDTTRIRALALETIENLQKLDQTEEVKEMIENQKEIERTAKKMDARTGTIDPSAKKAERPKGGGPG